MLQFDKYIQRYCAKDREEDFRAQMISSKTRVHVRRHRGAAAMLLGARRRDVVIARHNCAAPFISSITRLDWQSAYMWVERTKRLDRKGKRKERYTAGRNL